MTLTVVSHHIKILTGLIYFICFISLSVTSANVWAQKSFHTKTAKVLASKSSYNATNEAVQKAIDFWAQLEPLFNFCSKEELLECLEIEETLDSSSSDSSSGGNESQ